MAHSLKHVSAIKIKNRLSFPNHASPDGASELVMVFDSFIRYNCQRFFIQRERSYNLKRSDSVYLNGMKDHTPVKFRSRPGVCLSVHQKNIVSFE